MEGRGPPTANPAFQPELSGAWHSAARRGVRGPPAASLALKPNELGVLVDEVALRGRADVARPSASGSPESWSRLTGTKTRADQCRARSGRSERSRPWVRSDQSRASSGRSRAGQTRQGWCRKIRLGQIGELVQAARELVRADLELVQANQEQGPINALKSLENWSGQSNAGSGRSKLVLINRKLAGAIGI